MRTRNTDGKFRAKMTKKLKNERIRREIKTKKGQEEMVGFVVIVILVSVILLVLLGFLLKSNPNEAVNSYEVESFIQASLQYTTGCENQLEFLSIKNLIVSCKEGETCLDEKNSCDVLNETLKGIIENAWNVKEGSAVKGYKLEVKVNGEGQFAIKKGNETRNYRGSWEDFAVGSDNYEVLLNVYS